MQQVAQFLLSGRMGTSEGQEDIGVVFEDEKSEAARELLGVEVTEEQAPAEGGGRPVK